MSFSKPITGNVAQIGAGEMLSDSKITLAFTEFEDLLKIGRFAKVDAGSLDNLDSSATPVIAGVVMRNVANSVESDSVFKQSLNSFVNVARSGLVTVEVKTGETPTVFGAVFASNAGDADDGKALTAAGEATNAEFVEEIQTDVWSIRLI